MSDAVVDALLESVIIEPATKARAAVIWLHGLGADGHDFAPLVPAFGLEQHGVRFIFPHAPMRPITINDGAVMRAWFDVASFDIEAAQDETAIRESARAIGALVADQEARGIARQQIVIAGFSQGGAIALHYGLRTKTELAGIMALSTYLPLHNLVAGEATTCGKSLPIFYAHGSEDPLVSPTLAELSCKELRDIGVEVDWHSYPMAHEVCQQELADISQWLRARIGREG